MATKLKNMKLTSVDLVRAGANQEADICLFKSADPPEAPESPTDEEKNIFKRFIDWIRKNPTEAATEPPSPIEKTDEAPDLEYLYKSALADSLYSIMRDEALTEIEKKDMAEESLSQYSEKIRELNGEDEEAIEEEVQEEEPEEDQYDENRFDELEEIHVKKYNHHHGADGKFSSGGGGGGNAAAKRKIFQQAAAGKFSNRTAPSGPEYSGSKSEIFRQAAAAYNNDHPKPAGGAKYSSYSDFPKTVKYDGEEYYNAGKNGHMTTSRGGKAQSYVRWDDNNDEQYISMNDHGEIERD